MAFFFLYILGGVGVFLFRACASVCYFVFLHRFRAQGVKRGVRNGMNCPVPAGWFVMD